MDNKALQKLSYGLFVLTAHDGGFDNGCIINTAYQSASEPLRVSISVSKKNLTHDMIEKTGAFNVSVISTEADFSLFTHFGFQSGRDKNKFLNYDKARRADNGILYITEGTNAYFSVKVEKTQDLGSHTVFTGAVSDMAVLSPSRSATYEYYFENIKPKPEEKKEEGTVWRCRICGYEYKGEALPPDFICPLCKHPAEDFEKIEK